MVITRNLRTFVTCNLLSLSLIMNNGIICIETEWEHTVTQNRLLLQTKSLLDFLEKSYGCKVIYRRVATKSELQYYLNRFSLSEYKDYSIFYLSFHGDTHSIFLEGEKKADKRLTLTELSDMAKDAFLNRFVHFSSCRTLLGNNGELEKFKNDTGALFLSGYTKKVDGILSAINDIAYFDQIFRHRTKKALIAPAMRKYYEGLATKLGFKMF